MAHRTTKPKWGEWKDGRCVKPGHVPAYGRRSLDEQRRRELDRTLLFLATRSPRLLDHRLAAALKTPQTRQSIVHAVELHQEAVEALDRAPTTANVSAMAREIRRAATYLITESRLDGVSVPRPAAWRPWPSGAIERMEAILLDAMGVVRERPGGVKAVGELIFLLDRSDMATLDALDGKLRASELPEPGQPLEHLIDRLRTACEAVEHAPPLQPQASRDGRGRRPERGRGIVIHELDLIWRQHAGSNRRGWRLFRDAVLAKAGIPCPAGRTRVLT